MLLSRAAWPEGLIPPQLLLSTSATTVGAPNPARTPVSVVKLCCIQAYLSMPQITPYSPQFPFPTLKLPLPQRVREKRGEESKLTQQLLPEQGRLASCPLPGCSLLVNPQRLSYWSHSRLCSSLAFQTHRQVIS